MFTVRHLLILLAGAVLAWAPMPAAAAPVLAVAKVEILTGDGNALVAPNECNDVVVTLSNSGTDAVNVSAVLTYADESAFVLQPVSAYPDIPAGGTGTNLTSFTLSTTNAFPTGIMFGMKLQVTYSGGSATLFVVSNTMPGGQIAWQFHSNTPVPLRDNSVVESPVTVSGISGEFRGVVVSLYLNHTRNEDLRIQLVAPDGVAITLINRTGRGADFGQGCGSSLRTSFGSRLGPLISDGIAPYVGSYAPDQSLSQIGWRRNAEVNGVWKLRVHDTRRGHTGILNCWSLTLTPVTGGPSLGPCPGTPSTDLGLTITAPARIHNGEVLTYQYTVTNRSASDATYVTLRCSLPGEVDSLSWSLSQGTAYKQSLFCSFDFGTITAGTSATATIATTANTANEVSNMAWLWVSEVDTNMQDNTAVTTTVVEPSVNLTVTESPTPSPATRNQPLTHLIRVTNNGLDDATSVTITDRIADTVTFQSAWATTGTAQLHGRLVLCDVGPLGIGESAEMSVTVIPSNPGTLENTASAAAAEWESNPADNAVTRTVTVMDAAGVEDFARF